MTVLAKLEAYPDGDHPDGAGNLYARLEEEIADVYGAMLIVANNLNLSNGYIARRSRQKYDLFNGWMLERPGMPDPLNEAMLEGIKRHKSERIADFEEEFKGGMIKKWHE